MTPGFSTSPGAGDARSARRGAKRAFVLLEVLVSLTILAVTVSAVLRSFSQSFNAARRLEVETQAGFFAQQLLDEFETNPPPEGASEGGFGDDYRQYWFHVEVDYEYPDYESTSRREEISEFFPLRHITLEVNYDNGSTRAFRAIRIESAIIGFERFTSEARSQLQFY